MAKIMHTTLAGKLEVREDAGKMYVTIDGFNVIDELLLLEGMTVHLEAIAHETSPDAPELPLPNPPSDDIVRKLMGDDGQ